MSYVRFMLAELNRDSGGFAFEALARDLIHAEYCSNILPATGPAAGGDRGEDSRTHPTYLTESDEALRLYEGSARPTDLRIIFAFSIRKDWRAKIHSDIVKIFDNALSPDKIVFATNQPVPIRERQDAERELSGEFYIPIEILDATWFAQHLEGKHYSLAVRHLKCEPKPDEEMQRMLKSALGFQDNVFSEEDRREVRRLTQEVRYRSSYKRQEHLILDLKRIADIYGNYAEHTDDATRFYEEALHEARRSAKDIEPRLFLDTSYAYFKILFKIPSRRREIFKHLPEYRQAIWDWGHTTYFWNLNVWLYYLLQEMPDDPAFIPFVKESLDRFVHWDVTQLSSTSLARLLDAEIGAHLCLRLCETHRLDEDYYYARMSELIDKIIDASYFDVRSLARRVAVMAPHITRDDDYERLYERIETLAAQTLSSGERGALRCERGLKLFDAGKFQKAAEQFRLAKALYQDFHALRSRVCISLALAHCHRELSLFYVAEWELLQAVDLALMLPDNLQQDLATVAFQELHNICLADGRLLSALGYAHLYVLTRQNWRLSLPEAEEFVVQLDQNMILVLGSLYATNRRLHDAGLSALLKLIPADDSLYFDLVRETPEPLQQIYSKTETWQTMLKIYNDMRAGTLSSPRNIAPLVDERVGRLKTGFCAGGLNIDADFDSRPQCRLVAQTIFAALQHLLLNAESSLRDLAWVEDKVTLHVDFRSDDDATFQRPTVDVTEIPNNEQLEVRIHVTARGFNACATPDAEGYTQITMGVWHYLLNLCTLDPFPELRTRIEQEPSLHEMVRQFLSFTPYAYLVKTYLGVLKNDLLAEESISYA